MQTAEQQLAMYGVTSIQDFVEYIKDTATYQVQGVNAVMASLLSDAQEELAHGNAEGARKRMNLVKYLIHEVVDGELVFSKAR